MKEIPAHRTFTLRLRVTPQMTARFFDCTIHPLYATFALVEHAEYACRCAILPYLQPEEDAVGSAVEVEHIAPTKVGEIVKIEAAVTRVEERTVVCAFTAWHGERTIACGSTTQHILPKKR